MTRDMASEPRGVPEVEFVRDVVPQSEPDGEIRYPAHHCGGPVMPAEAAGHFVPAYARKEEICVCANCGALVQGDDLIWHKALRAWKAEQSVG